MLSSRIDFYSLFEVTRRDGGKVEVGRCVRSNVKANRNLKESGNKIKIFSY